MPIHIRKFLFIGVGMESELLVIYDIERRAGCSLSPLSSTFREPLPTGIIASTFHFPSSRKIIHWSSTSAKVQKEEAKAQQ